MIELDNFLTFLLEFRDDQRISISKKMKYGFRHYYISFSIDEEPKKDSSQINLHGFRFSDSLEIVIDNRNVCIEVIFENGTSNLIVEDEELVNKWSKIIDDLLNENISEKLITIFESTLNECFNKNLYREYQIRKIIKKDK